ncbi:hypothetical protein PQX77_019125 [Marasmius sp. AFHP31]|nr:hypothetical protein PQX77_019125 [Marasmius sp. AFHP31]
MASASRVQFEPFGNSSRKMVAFRSVFPHLIYCVEIDLYPIAIVEGIRLDLSSNAKKSFEAEHDDWNEDPDSPCYLFFPPPPKLPNGAPDIETWLCGESLYYYSYDPEGGSAITEQERIAFGLPSYTSKVRIQYVFWEADAYDFMEQWQKAKGFDYSMPDYAESLGFSILEGIPEDEVRFEDLIGACSEGKAPSSLLAHNQVTDMDYIVYLPEVLADDSMDVDSEFGSTRDTCNSSMSDVDMYMYG